MTSPTILHLSPGAFHRAHQAVYAEALIRAGHPEAGIRDVCLFPPLIGAAHAAQDGTYHVLLRDQTREDLRRITAIREVLDRPHPDMLCDPALRLVTMTLTEKGYCHVPGTDRLDPAAVAQDLADPQHPRTALGWLALALVRRRAAGLPGITLASCDNIPVNGRLLEAVLTAYVSEAFPDLLDWMAANVTFPVSMVDRIVPRVDAAAAESLAALAGAPDALGVVAEPFGQWVIEDRFAQPIPPLDKVGVQIVADVAPYERMKHRILNGAQTAIAHLGALSGFATSFDAASDPVMGAWLERFCAAQARTLACPPGEDLAAYCRATMERLRNPHIRHPLTQIGTDSSFKLGQRIVEAAEHHLEGPEARLYALTVAAWMRYNTGRDAAGRPIPVEDPLAPVFRDIDLAAGGDPSALVAGYLRLDLFEGPLRQNEPFRRRLVALCTALETRTPRDIILASLNRAEAEEELC
ncbi:mannitol dehydrogenase family protein [Cereibacter sphaeroides]|uniref:mannitol dehydrogenase family protein n=1 Tax=Cereibacter sphaeroides TaxID=1063 RepID=UPI000E5B6A55|nr:mannitol dehydrogenase family protein [Cereibacter sphaeroides]RIA00517.1 mannitol dehydrogenase family protein [Cereibacter sphaeroides]